MKRILLALLLVACASSKPSNPPVITPPAPAQGGDTIIYKHDTVTKADTVRVAPLVITKAITVTGATDTSGIYIVPSGGDDWVAIQAMIASGWKISPGVGQFHFSNALISVNLQGNDYGQSWCWIHGASPAQDAPGNYTTQFYFSNPNLPGLIIQQGKNSSIENVVFVGPYNPPTDLIDAELAQWEVNVLSRSEWVTTTRNVPTSPCAGIVIDAFSDPMYLGNDSTKGYPGLWSYYIPGMSRSGSTAIQIRNCSIRNWNVGILVTAVNQQNGESLTFENDYVGNCMSGFAFTQAQAKNNVIRHGIAWGVMRTVIDGVNYGISHGDGTTLPDVDGLNGAGMNHDLVEGTTVTFGAHFNDVYFENLYRIGFTGGSGAGFAGMLFTGCTFDFENEGPTPASWYRGGSTTFEGCRFRYYNGGGIPQRMVFNEPGMRIEGGMMGAPPVVVYGQGPWIATKLDGVGMYYDFNQGSWLSNNNYDSIAYSGSWLLRVNQFTSAGYYLSTDTSRLRPGTMLITEAIDSVPPNTYVGSMPNWITPVGYFDHFTEPDTVWLDNVGEGMKDSTKVTISKALYR